MISTKEYGNLLHSEAKCLVNAVNCEGFMGKGIAYQFKQTYPLNNQWYVQQCKEKLCTTGKILFFEEKGKVIANFPTKNKWREKSRYEFIELGLQALCRGIEERGIDSVAIPQLGCGNGGLEWERVKSMIYQYLSPLSKTKITLYENPQTSPSLTNGFDMTKANLSHLLLIYFKNHLKKFGKIRLQKTAFFYNVIAKTDYFKFDKYKFGPYSQSITILSEQIKNATQNQANNFKNIESNLYHRLMSDSVNIALSNAEKTIKIINQIDEDFDLEVLATLLHIISLHDVVGNEDIIREFLAYPKYEIERFRGIDFSLYINRLEELKLIEKNILGYTICP